MNKDLNFRICLVAISLVGCFCYADPTFAQVFTGKADNYSIKIERVELCTGNGGGNGCDSAFTLGSGESTPINIAGVNAGAQAGSYVSDPPRPPPGQYTYVRVTIARVFTLRGTVTVTGLGACSTNGIAQLGTGDPTAGGTVGIAAVDTNLTAPNPSANVLYPSNMKVPATESTSWMTITYPLSPAYVVAVTSGTISKPNINISFGTTTALGAFNPGGGGCAMFPNSPDVAVSVK